MNNKCRTCWDDIRDNVLNKIAPLGAHARRIMRIIKRPVCDRAEINKSAGIISDEVKAVEKYFKHEEARRFKTGKKRK